MSLALDGESRGTMPDLPVESLPMRHWLRSGAGQVALFVPKHFVWWLRVNAVMQGDVISRRLAALRLWVMPKAANF